ncbi:hypothetical protein ACEV60_26925, partial [Enterobacter ludwigii]|uniref:hypothetical protein n=1 Tax=Enterobacter ludwigii TaxID=299767 RepID=UPI003BEEDB9B
WAGIQTRPGKNGFARAKKGALPPRVAGAYFSCALFVPVSAAGQSFPFATCPARVNGTLRALAVQNDAEKPDRQATRRRKSH